MVRRTRWRLFSGSEYYESCMPQELGGGLLIWKGIQEPIAYFDNIIFQGHCDFNEPVYSSFKKTPSSFPYLDVVNSDWARYISDDLDGGPFKYSIYPVIFSFTANFVITLSLTVIVFINTRRKPSRGASNLLKLGSTLASVNLTIFVVKALKSLRHQHDNYSISSTNHILNILWNDLAFTGIDFIVVLVCQLCQVQVVMRLFPRVQEKRIVFFLGIFLSLICQTLWAIPTFSQSTDQTREVKDLINNLEILSPFVYLFRIALGGCYASIICFHVFTKKHICFLGKRMSLLTFLTILIVLLQPGFFVADVANVWIDDLSEIFNTTCYVGSTVIVWEWIDSLHIIERKQQAQSVLGRPIYEDEQSDYYFAKYALRIQNALSRKPDDSDDTGNCNPDEYNDKGLRGDRSCTDTSEPRSSSSNQLLFPDQQVQDDVSKVAFNKHKSLKGVAIEKCAHVLDSVLYYTDQVIVRGLGNKTMSLSSKSSNSLRKNRALVRKRVGLDRPNEVYVYSTQDVVFDSEDEENNEGNDEENK